MLCSYLSFPTWRHSPEFRHPRAVQGDAYVVALRTDQLTANASVIPAVCRARNKTVPECRLLRCGKMFPDPAMVSVLISLFVAVLRLQFTGPTACGSCVKVV